MLLNYSFSYLPCQSCHAKVNCHKCEASAVDSMKAHKGVNFIDINILKKELHIESSIDEDTLEEYFENIGIFI